MARIYDEHVLTDNTLICTLRGPHARVWRTSRAYTKAALVGALSRLPSLRLQQLAGVVVCRLWPAFRDA